MCYKIAIMSGKGGSGKTSLCLSIADLLATAGIKTLLVDCDLSTNGAAYFFEERLDTTEKILSVEKILHGKVKSCSPIKIKESFSFIPSVTSLRCLDNGQEDLSTQEKERFKGLFSGYEVVLFDCQAGYSQILDLILPEANGSLFVMEADAISSSAIRTLYLKIGQFLNNRTSYQVFNKVTHEEYEIYNKISGGTIFTNVETILFDWKIRKAFALSEIPSVANASTFYAEQILKVCKVIFRNESCQGKLKTFSKTLFMKRLREDRERLTKELDLLKKDRKKRRSKIIVLLVFVYMTVALFATLSMLVLKNPFGQPMVFENTYTSISIIISLISCILAMFVLMYTRTRVETNKSIFEYESKLSKIIAAERSIKEQD